MKDTIQITGRPTITLYDKYGNVKQHLEEDNLVVDVGKNFIIKKAFDRFTGAGDGTTTENNSDTSLENQIGETVISSYSVNGGQITLFATLGENVATGTINELAVLSDDDVLISRIVVSTPFNKAASDFLNISWSIQVG
jgi:hypothetical protein